MSQRIPSGFPMFAAGTLVLWATAFLAITAGEGNRRERALATLSLVSTLKSAEMMEELEEARSDAILWSGFGGIRQRLGDMDAAWAAMGRDTPRILRRIYLDDNPFPDSERYLLTDPGDGSTYSRIHAEFQPAVRDFLRIHGYQDVLLINASGVVIYSYDKADYFAADLLRGPLRETHLAAVARMIPSLPAGEVAALDFEPDLPGGGEWALFLASPISLAGGEGNQGALVFRLSPELIGAHLARSSRQRESAVSEALGEGYYLLGEPPWIEGADAGNSVESEVRERIGTDVSGRAILRATDGRRILAAWEPMSFQGLRWVVASSVDLEEVRREGAGERRGVAVIASLLWLALGVLTLGLVRPPRMGRHRI